MKKMLIDVCDVIIDVHNSALRMLNIDLSGRKITSWDMFDVLDAYEAAGLRALFDDPSYWKNITPIDGAIDGLNALKQKGHEIHFLTSPWYTCYGWESIRREWLAAHVTWFDPLDLTITSEKYRFSGDVLIDDRPKHVELWSANNSGTSYLFDTKFNKYYDWTNRVTWDEIRLI